MTHPFPDSIAQLLETADCLPYGRARLDVLQEAVQIADTLQDIAAGFWTRRRLIDDAAFCLRYDLYAVAFTWCLAAARKDPHRFSVADLLGHYQYVIGKMPNFPEVRREQYEALFADAVREFRAHGFSLRTIYLERRLAAVDFADKEMSEAADREWRRHSRDRLSCSVDYETGYHVEHDLFLGDDLAAVRNVEKFFARPKREHRHDPWISGLVLLPLLRLGRDAEAAAYYQIAARAAHDAGYVWSRGCHLEYLARIGDFEQGERELKIQLPAALAQPDPLSHFYCLRPATRLLGRMASAGVATMTMRAPPGVPWGEGLGVYRVPELREWTRAEAMRIASQFDKRNGSPFYSEWLLRTIDG